MGMPEPLETLEFEHGVKAHLYQDEDAESPRENDNLCTMTCWRRNHSLGDKHKFKEPVDFLRHLAGQLYPGRSSESWHDLTLDPLMVLIEKRAVIRPLWLMDHSMVSISMSKRRFQACDSDGWDWFWVGWIWVTHQRIREEATFEASGNKYRSIKRITPAVVAQIVERYMVGEVKDYASYLSGDVYGAVIETPGDANANNCWGLIGADYARERAAEMAERFVKEYGDPVRTAGADI